MACFDKAIGRTIRFEGGYVNDPDDPGGETNFGITKRAYPDLDIKNLTAEQACEIYARDYWNPWYDKIAAQAVATKLFDLGVNMGPRTAVKLLQNALIQLGAPIKADGVFGPNTLAALNRRGSATVLRTFELEAVRYYQRLAERRPTSRKYLFGWVRRALAVDEN